MSRLVCVLSAGVVAASASAQFQGPTPYLDRPDSPFAGVPAWAYFHVEDFEDGLNTPGLSASAGSLLSSGGLRDSVDADDGAIDGSGSAGFSWYSASSRSIDFSFDALVLGALPTHAGIVWTDVGFTDGTFCVGHVAFEAFDSGGLSLGSIGPFQVGDGAANGGTAEDRFLGVINLGGISRIRISMPDSGDWEVDHVQYGLVPAPGALALAGAAALIGARRRR